MPDRARRECNRSPHMADFGRPHTLLMRLVSMMVGALW
jgi:hypothetical protein